MLFLLLFLNFAYGSPFIHSIGKQELIKHGKKAYELRCAGCHGLKGDGNGKAAVFLNPKPRDFTSGVYKFRTSPLGTMPSDKDLMHTLSKGILGTSMPAFSDVPEQERFAIVNYLKTFSKNFEDEALIAAPVLGSSFPLEDFKDYKTFIERAKRGKKIFVEACILCHGNNGQGDGESSQDLEDDWGQKIVPANLTRLYIKSGKSVQDIYRVILTGVSGTPMPSFKDTYTDDALWDVSAWILYLRGVFNGVYEEGKLPLELITNKDLEN